VALCIDEICDDGYDEETTNVDFLGLFWRQMRRISVLELRSRPQRISPMWKWISLNKDYWMRINLLGKWPGREIGYRSRNKLRLEAFNLRMISHKLHDNLMIVSLSSVHATNSHRKTSTTARIRSIQVVVNMILGVLFGVYPTQSMKRFRWK